MTNSQSLLIIEKYLKLTEIQNKLLDLETFTKISSIEINEFHKYFKSIRDFKTEIWRYFFQETIDTLNISEEFHQYTAREKMLAFYYTWLEELKNNFYFVKLSFSNLKIYEITPPEFKNFENDFEIFTDSILESGKITNEIASRPLIENQLKRILTAKLVFIVKFWINDKSENYEKTDVAIEKSVHLAFDILSRNAMDSAYDFGKFLVTNRKKFRMKKNIQ